MHCLSEALQDDMLSPMAAVSMSSAPKNIENRVPPKASLGPEAELLLFRTLDLEV